MNPDIDPEIGNETSIINLSCRFNTLYNVTKVNVNDTFEQTSF